MKEVDIGIQAMLNDWCSVNVSDFVPDCAWAERFGYEKCTVYCRPDSDDDFDVTVYDSGMIEQSDKPENLMALTQQESGMVIYPDGEAIICNWSSVNGMPRLSFAGVIGLGSDSEIYDIRNAEEIDVDEDDISGVRLIDAEGGADLEDVIEVVKDEKFRAYQVGEAIVIAPTEWN